MKSKTVERLMDTTPQHIKDQVDLFADNLVNKQTAVEWLISQYLKDGLFKEGVYNQALEMEKQMVIDAFGVGCQVESTRLIGYHEMAEQYYNETYNK